LTCERCDGTGFEIVARDGRDYARPCVCRRPERSEDDVLLGCRVPPRYEHCSLATFEPGNASLRTALEKAMKYCSGYPYCGTDEGLGLLFTGDNGVGKTHLAVAVLRELCATKGARGQFWDFHELIREIKNSYNPETRTTELQVLAPIIEMDILVLDDLGAWKMTDWMHDTLFYILNCRYMTKRVTLITTNFQDVDREQALGADQMTRKEFLVERIGQRLRSRLMEMCLFVKMEGPDFRQQRQSGKRVAVLGRESGVSSLGRGTEAPPHTRGSESSGWSRSGSRPRRSGSRED
jgi:DNA replication protein DnaC